MTRPIRFRLGWTAGPQPPGLYAIAAVWSISLASAFLFQTFASASIAGLLGLAVVIVGAKSRGYVEVVGQTVRVSPTGILGSKFAAAIPSLVSVDVLDGPVLVLVDRDGRKHSFGPWRTFWGRETGMRSRCENAAAAVAKHLTEH